ncbi:MAG: type II secretion system inner membrane protein GspF [bacterium]|nr:type II secretion system inner membrane protein GspF [bacterium]
MPIFEYKGLDKNGKAAKGMKEADSVKSLRIALRRDGIFTTDISESSGNVVSFSKKQKNILSKEVRLRAFFERISAETLGVATRQLSTLLQAGVTLVDALNALIEQTDNQKLKQIFSEIKSDVNEGTSLADAMSQHKCFSTIYVNMVRAGESSGALEVVLERLAEFLESQAQLKSKIMGAMMYPAVMMSVGGLVMIIMLTTVVPKISKIFLHAKIQLPLMTRILIGTSSFISNYWWFVLLVMLSGGYLLRRYITKPVGKLKWDRLKLKIPVVGRLIEMISVARFSRTLSTLLASGVPLLASLQIVRNVLSNQVLENAIDDVREAVKEGEDIGTPLKRSGCFPPMVTHMIAIGEKSGQLENMLNRVATSYEQQVQVRVGMLTGLLEPVMILLMGGGVGFIVFAILTPIMQMSQLVK